MGITKRYATEDYVDIALDGKISAGLPTVTTDDNDKILQVVNGEWSVISIVDSAVKTYIDNYIDEALGGDY